MRVVLLVGGGEVDVEVAVHDPSASVSDLAAAIAADPSGLVVDGVLRPGRALLLSTGLRAGCGVTPIPHAPEVPAAAPVAHAVELLVVGGIAAGARHPLALGDLVVGRDPLCSVVLADRTTSSRHAHVRVAGPDAVSLADAGSTSGTWIDGCRVDGVLPLPAGAVAALGATLVRTSSPTWREPAVLGRPGADGRLPLHRPPPRIPMPLPHPVAPPGGDPPRGEAPRFGWAAALVPLVGGVALAVLVDPRLALFTLLGPAVLAGQWLEDRRRHRRRGADAGVTRRTDITAFVAAVEAAGMAEASRRRATHPDPAALGEEIEALGSRLWSRRRGHPAFAEVDVGSGPALSWAPATTGPAEGPAAAVLAAAHLPHGCPAPVALGEARHLGIAGVRAPSLAVARWVVLQLTAHHGPADIRIAVVCTPERASDWSWAGFLPHTTACLDPARRLLATGPAQAREVAELHTAPGLPHLVVVVDGDGLVEPAGPAAALAGGTVATLTIGPSRRALPARCDSILELDGSDGWAHLASGGAAPQALLATGVDLSRARTWSRRLAGLADPEAAGDAVAPPRSARLLDLLGLDAPTADGVRRGWSGGRGASIPIGLTGGPDGPVPVLLDLVADGPHVLVAGTTGAGKSELLRSLVAGLAASLPPARLAMLLVDYKGGAAFAEAASLPHVVGVVTDLGPEEANRALHSLEAELRRRERVLADLGVRDLADHPASGPGAAPADVEPLPRLVVVIDELAALAAELPSFLDDLVQLAARGRSLGLHLVLATQRPGSVVSASVRTNCAVRLCLRVPDEADAVDVVGSAAPARLSRRQPGRAYLRRGAGDLVEVQVAMVGGRRPEAGRPVTVAPATFSPQPEPVPVGEQEGPNDLVSLVAACHAAAVDLVAPRPLWLPPLPPTLAASGLPPGGGGDGDHDVVFGLVDDPRHQRRLPLSWQPRQGPLVALGPGPGPALALQAVARVLAGRLHPGSLHVYGLDLAAQGLASLGELPHVGGIVRLGEHERLHRLIQRLGDEMAARQAAVTRAATADRPPLPPLVLVLVDGVAALRGALDGAGGMAALDVLERVVVDGSRLGMAVAVAADRLAALPGAWSAAASRRLAFRGGDLLDLVALGVGRVDQTSWPAGRCLDLTSSLLSQIATEGWPDLVGDGAADDGRRGPAPIGVLPTRVTLAEVLARCAPSAGASGLRLPLGIEGRGLDVAVARLRPGQPFLVCGPPGSGRTATLATVAAAAHEAGCAVVTAGADLAERVAAAAHLAAPTLMVLVDDAERVADPDGSLALLAAGRHAGAHLVATATHEGVRGAFGHWSAELRRTRCGVVLRPGFELDADVLGVPVLPRWPVPLTTAGRGVLVNDGDATPVQLATS